MPIGPNREDGAWCVLYNICEEYGGWDTEDLSVIENVQPPVPALLECRQEGPDERAELFEYFNSN